MLRYTLLLFRALILFVVDALTKWHFYRASILHIDRLLIKICVEQFVTAAKAGQYV